LYPGLGKHRGQIISIRRGLGAGQGVLVVPTVSRLTAYAP
jgi:hypothetical protein